MSSADLERQIKKDLKKAFSFNKSARLIGGTPVPQKPMSRRRFETNIQNIAFRRIPDTDEEERELRQK